MRSRLTNLLTKKFTIHLDISKKIFSFIIFVLLILNSYVVLSCSVPVFRYALEHWQSDYYEAIVFHRGTLSKGHQEIIDMLKSYAYGGTHHSNMKVQTVNLAENPDASMQKLWKSQTTLELPWMVVRYPAELSIEEDAWAGHLSADNVKALVDSPERQELAQRILKGDSIVWVLLESGNQSQDDAVAALLKDEIEKIEKILKVQDPIDNPSIEMKFTIMRVNRNAPAEKIFVDILFNCQPGLRESSEPMAFPVFGRGRNFGALLKEHINENNIRTICKFLVGECSCMIKALNPGMDLLMNVDWENKIEKKLILESIDLPSLVGLSTSVSTGEINQAREEAKKTSSALFRNVLIAIVVGLIAILIISSLFKI